MDNSCQSGGRHACNANSGGPGRFRAKDARSGPANDALCSSSPTPPPGGSSRCPAGCSTGCSPRSSTCGQARSAGRHVTASKPMKKLSVQEVFDSQYYEAQYAFVEFISSHLSACSAHFGGDLQKVLVLAILGQAFLDGYRRREHRSFNPVINASRIAEITKIPRQTVNRKLRELEHAKLVEKIDLGWQLVHSGYEADAKEMLQSLERQKIQSLTRLFDEFEKLSKKPKT